MSGPVSFKIEGLSQMDAALGELTKGTARNTLRRVGVKALQVFADRASELAPDDPASGPPDLHRSIKVGTKLTPRQQRMAKKSDSKSFAEVYAGADKDVNQYAHLVEFGDGNQSPQPFMRPAWDETKDQVLKNVVSSLKPEIDKSVARARAKALK